MSKLLYSATMSLDRFIAGIGGDMSWLTPHVSAAWSGPSIVLTHEAARNPHGTDVTYVGDLLTAVDTAKRAAAGSTSTASAPTSLSSVSTGVCSTRSSGWSRPQRRT